MVLSPFPGMTHRSGKEEEARTTCSMRDSLASDETPRHLSLLSVGERCEGRNGSSSVLVVNVDGERLVLCAMAEGCGKNPTAHRLTNRILHNIATEIMHDAAMETIRGACVKELERTHDHICSTSTERDDGAMVTVVVVNESRRKVAIANVGDLHVARILLGCDRVELLSEFLPQIKPHAQHLGILGAVACRPKLTSSVRTLSDTSTTVLMASNSVWESSMKPELLRIVHEAPSTQEIARALVEKSIAKQLARRSAETTTPLDAAVCIVVKLASGSPVPQFVLQREAARLNHRRPDAQQPQQRTPRSTAAGMLRRLFISGEKSKHGASGPRTIQSKLPAHPAHASLNKDAWWSLTLIPVEDADASSSSRRSCSLRPTKLPPVSDFDIAFEAAQSKIKALQRAMSLPPPSPTPQQRGPMSASAVLSRGP